MSLSDKYLAKAWPSVTKLVTLGLDERFRVIFRPFFHHFRIVLVNYTSVSHHFWSF
ncbi:hypothetical protein ES703_74587 [subsurface metagenome]